MQEIRTSGSMSGDGKRSVAAWPKLPRPSSTLPPRRFAAVRRFRRDRSEADNAESVGSVFHTTKTHLRHWLCTAAMVLMPVSAPIKVLV
jgi:hypothetical protein